jgi:hypothetical protein
MPVLSPPARNCNGDIVMLESIVAWCLADEEPPIGLQRRSRPLGRAAVTGAGPGGDAAIGAQAPVDVLLESPESRLRFVRQPAGLVQARQPLLKLSKHVA